MEYQKLINLANQLSKIGKKNWIDKWINDQSRE